MPDTPPRPMTDAEHIDRIEQLLRAGQPGAALKLIAERREFHAAAIRMHDAMRRHPRNPAAQAGAER